MLIKRLLDENLELRHQKRGMLSLVNQDPHSNGSNFLVTFGDAHYLDGYQSIIGEMVQGEDVLVKIEADSSRSGTLGSEWTIFFCKSSCSYRCYKRMLDCRLTYKSTYNWQ